MFVRSDLQFYDIMRLLFLTSSLMITCGINLGHYSIIRILQVIAGKHWTEVSAAEELKRYRGYVCLLLYF